MDFDLSAPARGHPKIYSQGDGRGDFKLLARDTVLPSVNIRLMLVPGRAEVHAGGLRRSVREDHE